MSLEFRSGPPTPPRYHPRAWGACPARAGETGASPAELLEIPGPSSGEEAEPEIAKRAMPKGQKERAESAVSALSPTPVSTLAEPSSGRHGQRFDCPLSSGSLEAAWTR